MSGIQFTSGIDDGFLRDLKAMNTQMNNLSANVEIQGAKMEAVFKNVGRGIATYIGVDALRSVGGDIVETTAKFEKFGIVLENTLGNKPDADNALVMVAKFAAKTPFQLDEVTDSFIKLTNQGFQPTYAEMEKLGDVASSTGKGFNQLAEALLDAQTNQFERLKEFGIKASANGDKVTFTFKGIKTTVDNTAQSIQQYILSLGELKGVAGANAKISEGMAGSISNLSDEFAAMYNNIGKNNKEVITDSISGIRFLVQNYETIGKILAELVLVYGTYKAALMVTVAWQEAQAAAVVQTALAGRALTSWEVLQTAILYKVNAAQKALNATILANPYALAATAVAAFIGVLVMFADTTSTADETMQELADSIASSTAKAGAGLKNLAALNDDVNTTLAGRKKLIEEINSNYGQYLTNSLSDSATQAEITKALKEANVAMDQKIKLDALRAKMDEERQKLQEMEAKVKSRNAGLGSYFAGAQASIDIPKQKQLLTKLQAQIVAIQEESAKKEIDVAVKKVRTIKVIEGELQELIKTRKEKTDVKDTPALQALQVQIDAKQKELDALNGKEAKQAKDTRLDVLNTTNQQRINAITEQYGREESMQKIYQQKLLENEVLYQTERGKIASNALEKAESRGGQLRAEIALQELREKDFKELLSATKSYNEQYFALQKKADADIAELQKAGYGDHAEIRKQQYEQAQDTLAEQFAKESKDYQVYIETTLPSIIKDGADYVQGEIERLSQLLEMEIDPAKIALVSAELQKVREALATVNKDLEKNEKKLTFRDTLEALKSMHDSLTTISEALGKGVASSALQVVGGVLQIATALDAATTAMTGLEKASLILAAIAAAIKVVSFLANNAEQKRLANQQALASQLETHYAITEELIKQNALYEEGNSFFSKDSFGKLLANLKAYNAALINQDKIITDIGAAGSKRAERFFTELGKRDLAVDRQVTKEAQALATINVKTRDRKALANAVGFSDSSSSLMELYPDLLDAQGKLNDLVLEQAISEGRMAATDTARLQALLDNSKAMKSYYAEFGDYISGIFGNIGDAATEAVQSLYEAIVIGAEDSEVAMQSLERSISDMIETFTRDSIKYAFIQPMLNSLNDTTKTLGTQYASGEISADKMQTDITTALGAFYQNIKTIQPQLLDAYANADKLAAAAGFTSAFNGESSANTSTSLPKSAAGQIQATITEQTGTILAGYSAATMLNTEKVATISQNMLEIAMRNTLYLQQISINSNSLPNIEKFTKAMSEKL